MMKSIDELGISPTPWSFNSTYGEVLSKNAEVVAKCNSLGIARIKEDDSNARIIAATPKLYVALEECERKLDAIEPYGELLEKVREALALAGGEYEVKDGSEDKET